METSIRFAGWVEDLDMEYYEDPAPDLAGMAAVAQATPIPLATNMVVTAFTHIAPSVQMDAVQVVLADHHHWGGMQASLTLAKICETFRLGISQHSNSHTGNLAGGNDSLGRGSAKSDLRFGYALSVERKRTTSCRAGRCSSWDGAFAGADRTGPGRGG